MSREVVIVAAGIVRDEKNDRVLGYHRASTDELEFPGGKVDPGEQPRDAVEREIFEESGLVVHAGDLVFSKTGRKDDHDFVVLFFECSLSSLTNYHLRGGRDNVVDPKTGDAVFWLRPEAVDKSLVAETNVEAYRMAGLLHPKGLY